MNGRQRILAAFRGDAPDYVPFAPNIYLWFYYHYFNHNLPPELDGCRHPLDAVRALGGDILARWDAQWAVNKAYTGGVYHESWDGESDLAEARVTSFNIFPPGKTEHLQSFATPFGTLTQKWVYSPDAGADFEAKHWWTDWDEYPAVRYMLEATEYEFDAPLFRHWVDAVGDDGIMMCHVTQSPLKALHWLAGPANASLFIHDHPAEMAELARIHEEKALRLVAQLVDEPAAEILFSGDNLDSAFYSPRFYADFCASFYERCADLAHSHDKFFVVHACGRSKKLLPQVGASAVDCLEGITPRPQGDVELADVRALTGRAGFVVNGGMDAPRLTVEDDAEAAIHQYTHDLFAGMGNRRSFIFASSCMTPVPTPWQNLIYFRDAARAYGKLA